MWATYTRAVQGAEHAHPDDPEEPDGTQPPSSAEEGAGNLASAWSSAMSSQPAPQAASAASEPKESGQAASEPKESGQPALPVPQSKPEDPVPTAPKATRAGSVSSKELNDSVAQPPPSQGSRMSESAAVAVSAVAASRRECDFYLESWRSCNEGVLPPGFAEYGDEGPGDFVIQAAPADIALCARALQDHPCLGFQFDVHGALGGRSSASTQGFAV